MTDAAANPLKVDLDQIPLPPEDVIKDMLADEQPSAPTPQPAAPAAAPQVETLDFVKRDVREKAIPLEHPFRRDGALVEQIVVRRLTGFEVGEFVRTSLGVDKGFDRFELYATMTGVPAPVLRGLDQDDLMALTDVASDFLPRGFAARG
ncbi:phage tail assembly protein [Methylopila sp. 73B]|uniref:phage tail assembly protein n=1 Tax=Methylopila sp. 73B TaxID=1120792 RepID=UPI00036F0DBC|nr:phage tail assembly protein [Methylopila sp. 73B]